MGQRQQARFKSVLPIRIWWVAADGTRYSRLTHTLDIHQGGARVGGVREPLAVGDLVTLQYKQNRGNFKVAWVGKPGTPTQSQIGLTSLEEKSVWGELPIEEYTDTYIGPSPSQTPISAPTTKTASQPPKSAPAASVAVKAAPAAAPTTMEQPGPPGGVAATPSGPATLTHDAVKGEITRRLQYATEELREIDELIKVGDVDPAVLNEFREALALARHTSWGVQQWFELHEREGKDFPLLSFLIEERLVVATRLCHQLARDVAELSVAVEPASMEALIGAVGELAEKLSHLQLHPGGADKSQATAQVEHSLEQSVPRIEKPPQLSPLQEVVQRALGSTGADGIAIAFLERTEMVCQASAGIAPEAGVRWHASGGLSGEALRARQLVYCEDTESDARVDPVLCRAANLRSCLIIPILVQGTATGTVEAYSSRPRAFSREHGQSLAGIAGSIGSILQRQRAAEAK